MMQKERSKGMKAKLKQQRQDEQRRNESSL